MGDQKPHYTVGDGDCCEDFSVVVLRDSQPFLGCLDRDHAAHMAALLNAHTDDVPAPTVAPPDERWPVLAVARGFAGLVLLDPVPILDGEDR
jgi:hypothetical protein